MMTERVVIVCADVEIGWPEVFSATKKLLEITDPTDVRWVHVERAKAIYEKMLEKFNEKKEGQL